MGPMFGSAHRRKQGDLGEAAAIEWLTRAGAENVLVPLFHSPDYDLVAEHDSRLLRVQVKTSGFQRHHRYEVRLCTSGGNQSWSGVVKRFAAERCDFLFVLVADGRRWFIPSGRVEAGTLIRVGGPKYAAYQVDPDETGQCRR
jgi:hypothetical protein